MAAHSPQAKRKRPRSGKSKAPQAGPSAARRELLTVQKLLWKHLNREMEASFDENPPNVKIYQEEFERDVRRYEAVATKAELVQAASEADVVYIADYHSLPQAQKTVVKLLLALAPLRPAMVLCVEVVYASDQRWLDKYMDESIDDDEFLRRIDYYQRWGFEWGPYREILQVARKLGVRVVGINSDPLEHEHDHLLERDFVAAKVIADQIREQPEALCLVFDGDLHVARDHLPLIVDTVLRERERPPRRRLIVHQNAEEIYWKLALEEVEQDVSVVRLAKDAYCILNATPFEKLHSYLNWVGERETLAPPDTLSSWTLIDDDDLEELDEDDVLDRGAEYAEQVHRVVRTLANFLDIERDDLDGFELFTVNDLDFLDYLAEGGSFNDAEIEDVKRQIVSNESYFIPKGNIIYLSDFSLINAAEEATHFFHHLCSAYRWDQPRTLVTDFYLRCVVEALGYFGSKLIVPTREVWTEADCQAFVDAHRERAKAEREAKQAGKLPPNPEGPASSMGRVVIQHNQRDTLRACRLTLEHRALERTYLESGEWGPPGRALTQKTEVHLLLTHMLGHMLGDKLFAGLVRSQIDKATLKDLFHVPLDKGNQALKAYQQLVKLTDGVAHLHAERL